jgi:hypothetical protein
MIDVTSPPRVAERLLIASLAASECDAVVGDLREEFITFVVPIRGPRAARWWYRGQVVRSLLPLWIRAWQRASVARASVACAVAGVCSALPATLLLTLRAFLLQQVPLKTTAEVSIAFAAALLAVVIVGIGTGLSIAIQLLNRDGLSAD